MLALMKTQKGVGFLELREVPEPVPGPGEVLIEVKACGICGTDLHVLHDQFPYWPPVILGHEFAGQVVALGPDVTRTQVGDRVVGEPHTQACGHCYLCRTGNIQICPDKRSPGWGIDGAFARYLKMPERLLHRIPDEMSYDVAAVVEPTANTVHDVVERAKVEAGDLVVVLGPGPIGLLAALTARAGGARHIVMVGTPADEAIRLKKARALGFETVINVAEQNPLEVVRDLTGGIGADLVVECSGAAPAIASTVELVRKKGRICAIGLTGKESISFPWDKAAAKVVDLFFSMSTSHTSWNRTIHLIATGRIPAGEVITHRFPLTEWQQAFEEVEAQRTLKVLLVP
ncbi:MAG: alcohol dehydrogenase catalytic domain-containing protein [Armatimonadetes bacterium]|jgi:L-iditol 2-dehydrogenase|nr:alcohol dehydrogenase catalytic domain-containing protein [Armatimonadota bacterium]